MYVSRFVVRVVLYTIASLLFYGPLLAGPTKQVLINTRLVEANQDLTEELGVNWTSGFNGCHDPGDMQLSRLGDIPNFAESAGSAMGKGMLGSMMGGSSMSMGLGGDKSGGMAGSRDPFANMPDGPVLAKNPFARSPSVDFGFGDGTQIGLQLRPTLFKPGPDVDPGDLYGGATPSSAEGIPGTEFGIRINEPAVRDSSFIFGDAVLVGPNCKRYMPSGRLVYKVFQRSTLTWSIEYWRWRDEVLQEHWLKTGSQSWINEIGGGALPLWVGVRFDGVTPSMLAEGKWSLVTGWTYEQDNGLFFQPRVFDILPPTTKVRIDGGESVAIGGLKPGSRKGRLGKVPMLGDIPFAGKLFQDSSASDEKDDLVIFITPRVIPEM
jgi:hypothetical protein